MSDEWIKVLKYGKILFVRSRTLKAFHNLYEAKKSKEKISE